MSAERQSEAGTGFGISEAAKNSGRALMNSRTRALELARLGRPGFHAGSCRTRGGPYY